ncbi:MAG: hypothetical protein ACFB0Z_00865 [Candidatus Phaeomarinobacter sp.]
MTQDLFKRPSITRWIFALALTIVVAPLVSPLFLFWGHIVFQGASTTSEYAHGIVSGAIVALSLGTPPSAIGALAVGGIIFLGFDKWALRHWCLWALLGGVAGGMTMAAAGLLIGMKDGLLPFVGNAVPAGAISTLVMRAILLAGQGHTAGRAGGEAHDHA